MPRKRRVKESPAPEVAATEPTPVAEVLANSPMAQLLASREAKALTAEDGAEPNTDAAKAVAAFKRQRQREQAVTPPETIASPERRVKSWGETVRPWTSHGETGVKHVTATSPNMVGIAFPKSQPRTDEEKRRMEAIGLKFFREAEAWLKPNRDGAFDETQDMARRFAQQRREEAQRAR
jgi:hypothetical protein